MVLLNHIFPNFLYQDAQFASIGSLIANPSVSADFLRRMVEVALIVAYFTLSDGGLAVQVFFVLSGLVLSIGFFRKRKTSIILDQARRRYFRLTIPVLASALAASFLMSYDLFYNKEMSVALGNPWIGRFYSFAPCTLDAVQFGIFDVFFRYDEMHTYNFSTWTMGTELTGSFLTFGLLLLLARAGFRYRVVAYSIVAAFTIAGFGSISMASFVAGTMLADLRIEFPALTFSKFVIVLLLLAAPLNLVRDKFSTLILADIIHMLLAALIVAIVCFTPCAQRFLQTRISNMLGRLSFPLYLVHPILLCSIVSAIGLWLLQLVEVPQAKMMTAVAAVVICCVGALLFDPIEKFSIVASRAVSRAISAVPFLRSLTHVR